MNKAELVEEARQAAQYALEDLAYYDLGKIVRHEYYDATWQAVDGHKWIIYTAYHAEILAAVDVDDYAGRIQDYFTGEVDRPSEILAHTAFVVFLEIAERAAEEYVDAFDAEICPWDDLEVDDGDLVGDSGAVVVPRDEFCGVLEKARRIARARE